VLVLLRGRHDAIVYRPGPARIGNLASTGGQSSGGFQGHVVAAVALDFGGDLDQAARAVLAAIIVLAVRAIQLALGSG
jgi:hypothetical protein